MSLLALLSTAVAIPLITIIIVFFWFLIRARLAEKDRKKKKRTMRTTKKFSASPPLPGLNEMAKRPISIPPAYVPTFDTSTSDYKPIYQPLSHYLDGPTDIIILDDYDILLDLTIIPGITKSIEEDLRELGYTCIEQIARWGRADVRAVSADLGIDQQHIEEQWVANARLILSLG